MSSCFVFDEGVGTGTIACWRRTLHLSPDGELPRQRLSSAPYLLSPCLCLCLWRCSGVPPSAAAFSSPRGGPALPAAASSDAPTVNDREEKLKSRALLLLSTLVHEGEGSVRGPTTPCRTSSDMKVHHQIFSCIFKYLFLNLLITCPETQHV